MSDRLILQSISRIAQSMRYSEKSKPRRLLNDDVLTRFPSQLIPSAATIFPQLQEIGLSCVQAEELSNAYLKACSELRSVCESSLRNAIASLEGPVMTDTVVNMVRIWSAEHSKQTTLWAESALSRARELTGNIQSQNSPGKKSSFNHVCNSLLAHHFTDIYRNTPLFSRNILNTTLIHLCLIVLSWQESR
jgi:hypothetical protein